MRPARILFRSLSFAGLLVIIPPLVLIALMLTESGSGWMLRQTPGLLRPLGIEFSIESSQGSLLKRLQLNGVRFTMAGTSFEAAHLLLQWRPLAILDRQLHIQALELADVRLQLPPPVDSPASVPEIPDIVLPIALQLDRFLLERLQFEQAETRMAVTRTALAVKFDEQGLTLRDLDYEGGGVQLEGVLSMQATAPHTLNGEISVNVDASLTGERIGAVQAIAVLDGTALGPKFNLTLNAPTELRLSGSLKLDQLEPGFDLLAEWPQLQWPLQGTPTVTARTGSLKLNGVASAYRLELNSQVSGEGIPPAGVDLVAQGNLQGVTLQPLKILVLDGGLQASGKIGWDETIRWDLELLAEHINPGGYQPEWPGSIDGRIDVSGTFDAQKAGQISMQTIVHKLGGELRGQMISASGGLDYQAGAVLANKFELASGPNRVYLDGSADEQLDLSFDIKAPELASLFPGLSGRLDGAGRLKGTRQAPAVSAELNGYSVAYQDLQTQNIRLNLDWQESGGNGELRVTGLDAQGLQVSEISAVLSGTPASHRLDLTVAADPYSGEMSARGGLRERTWEGELAHLSLTEPALGAWILPAPAKLRLSETVARSGLLCLAQDAIRFCTEGGWSKQQGLDLVGRLEGVEFARLTPLIPGPAVIEGDLRGEFKASGPAERPNLVFRLDPGDGLIRVEEGEEPFELAYRNARISGRFENDRGSADLQFELGTAGKAQGRLQLGAAKGGERSLGGEVKIDFPDLALVAGFVPALERVDGRLHLEAALGGTVTKPQITGALQIENASAEVPAAGLALSDIQLAVRGDGNTPLQVQGQVRSGEGRLVVEGNVDLASANGPSVDLKLEGENFQAVRLPEALVEISPDLRLQGSGALHLSGNLRIPKAVIELRELPSGTVAVSEDEIIIGQESTKKSSAETQNLTARVRVVLGDTVTFKGFGLETALTGAVDARVDSKSTSVNGKIELRDGRYKSYGQNLTVEQGRLLFAGPPGNPDVDLRAIRMSRDEKVKAILGLSGPLSKPRPRIYSEPSLPDAEALAYLLTGKGLAQAGQSEGSDIAGAALSLGMSKGEPQLQQMSERLGLDELSFDSGDGGIEESSLVLGKYLNPDLYLGYSQGLFNPEGAVLLRLKLSEKLEVESRSGNEQSVDLFYRLEHD